LETENISDANLYQLVSDTTPPAEHNNNNNNNNNNNKAMIHEVKEASNEKLLESTTKREISALINAVRNEFCWREGLDLWLQTLPPEEHLLQQSNLSNGVINFRVTCKRSGERTKAHFGSSMEIAKVVGAVVEQLFKWKVSLTKFDIELYIHLQEEDTVVGIPVVKDLLSRRYGPDTGPGLLKPSIAYSMCRIANIQRDDVVMDPMCGVGTIILEAASSWTSLNVRYIASDIDPKQCIFTYKNVEKLNFGHYVSVLCSNVVGNFFMR